MSSYASSLPMHKSHNSPCMSPQQQPWHASNDSIVAECVYAVFVACLCFLFGHTIVLGIHSIEYLAGWQSSTIAVAVKVAVSIQLCYCICAWHLSAVHINLQQLVCCCICAWHLSAVLLSAHSLNVDEPELCIIGQQKIQLTYGITCCWSKMVPLQ